MQARVSKTSSETTPETLMRDSLSSSPSVYDFAPADGTNPGLAIASGGRLLNPEKLPTSLVQLLQCAAAKSAAKKLICIGADGSECSKTYVDLLEEAQQILRGFRTAGLKPGDKIIFQCDLSRDFLPAFWGAILGGFIPVPVSIPSNFDAENRNVIKLKGAWELLESPFVLTTATLAPKIKTIASESWRIATVEELRSNAPDRSAHQASANDLALMMLTSGSTGLPKGVMLSHKNLIARCAGTQQLHNFSTEDVSLSWMPLDHVASLIYFHLRDVFIGCQQIHVATPFILQNPLRWLDLIHRYRVTLTFAPNFAFGLVNEREREISRRGWDLSSVRYFLNGGESIAPKTARKFVQILGRHGLRQNVMRPAWGMSEISSGVTYGDRFSLESTSDTDHVTEVGRPIPGISLRIVDENDQPLAENKIGRLQCFGLTVMSGYYRNEKSTTEAFTKDGWFKTGDLGLLRDGRLTITGREKDVIIINGVNYYSHEIEALVEEIADVEPSFTAACSVHEPQSEREKLVVFFSSRNSSSDVAAISREIRVRVGQSAGINPDYVIALPKENIPKTEIGKIQRTKLKLQFEKGDFNHMLPGKNRSNSRPLAYCDGGPLQIPETAPKTLTEAFLRSAISRKNQGLRAIDANGNEVFQTYEELLQNAKRVLAGLRERGLKAGDRAILQVESLTDHFATFWGCVLGGIIPVTVAIPATYSESQAVVRKVHNIWKLLEGPSILASEHLVAAIRGLEAPLQMTGLKVLSVNELKQHPPTDAIYNPKPTDVVFYQLTSGSTGIPKCIQETHRAIIAHIHGSQQFNSYSPDDVTFNWLPMDHVVPILTFHLKDVCLGIQQIHAKTEFILTNPLRWLDVMHTHRVTHTWAPNFGFKLVSDALSRATDKTWDLSCLKFAMNAGEQVTGVVVADFLARLKPFGVNELVMQPAFGMAEVCTCMTYENRFANSTGPRRFLKSTLATDLQETRETGPTTTEFVSLGPVMPGVEIRIANSKNEILREGVIGRLQIRGTVVTPGYLKNEEANRDAFVGEGWFNTGDLGFILDKNLFITGREKEMIIVRGANFYCYEIEDVVNRVEGVEPTFSAACAVEDSKSGTEGLAIFFVPKDNSETAKLISEVRSKVAAAMGIAPAFVVPLEKKTFPKTTSGKIQRTQLKKALQNGEFDSLLQQLTTARTITHGSGTNETERAVAQIWQEVLQVSDVSPASNFFELGGDSLRAFQIISRVRDHFGVDLPLSSLFESASSVSGMAQSILASKPATAGTASIPTTPRDQKLPLSYGQQRIWLMDQIEGGTSYNVSRGVWLNGSIEVAALEKSLNTIVARHESLRTVFALRDGELLQTILPELQLGLSVVDVRNVPDSEREQRALELAGNEAARHFDLSRGPLIRAKLFQLESKRFLLSLCFHQIIVDGWSMGVLFKELTALYQVYTTGGSALPELSIQYADFAQWQKRTLTSDSISKQLGYWTNQLKGELPVLKWPSDNKVSKSARAKTELLVLPTETLEKIKGLNRAEETTLFMTLLAVFKALLHRYSGQEDILVGTAVSGRTRLEIEKLIGFFVNTIVLRSNVTGTETFRDFLAKIRRQSIDGYAHAEMPFEQLVEQVQRNSGRTDRKPLFQAWFSFMDSMAEFKIGDASACPVHIPPPEAQFDLSIFVIEKGHEVNCYFEYKTDLFSARTIERIMSDFNNLLSAALSRPEAKLSELFSQLQSHAPTASQSSEHTIHEIFEIQAAQTPTNVAVTCGDCALTYRDLNMRANQLAHYLRKKGVSPETLVGIAMERSIETVVSILAVLKAGGAYVPLDPNYPAERLNEMIRQIDSPILLTQASVQARLPIGLPTVLVDYEWSTISAEPTHNPGAECKPTNLAYLIFTSGSTGKPKGVMVEHRNLVFSTKARFAYYPERVTGYVLISSFSFDSSVAGIFWTLCSGGNLILPQEGLQQDPREITRLIDHWQASHFLCLPSLYSLILEPASSNKLKSLRAVIVAGESCPKSLVERHSKFAPNTALYNEYGPTEGTVWATVAKLNPAQPVTIGKSIPGADVHLFDETGKETAPGSIGEIYVGGPGVVRGYLHQPELTHSKFVRLNGANSPRLYRTGDLGRLTTDGTIEFLGRADHQVKIRGYRIELEEIENVLSQHPAVRESVVVARKKNGSQADNEHELHLIGYAVPAGKQIELKTTELQEYAAARLPDYMVPRTWVILDALPQTPNGKVDRNALPEPAKVVTSVNTTPFTPLEAELAKIWCDVLRCHQVGLDDVFFQIGGHSLLAIQLISRIRDQFQIDLPLRVIFEKPTIRQLAEEMLVVALEQDTAGTTKTAA